MTQTGSSCSGSVGFASREPQQRCRAPASPSSDLCPQRNEGNADLTVDEAGVRSVLGRVLTSESRAV